MKDLGKKKVTTPKFRVSFPHIFKPHSGFEGQDEKFSVVMLFDKRADLSQLKAAAEAAIEEKWPDPKKRPKNLRMPFRDGNEKDTEGYQDTIFITASAKKDKRPGLVDINRQPILDEGEFYAGCYARATVIAFAYDMVGNRGVSFALQNVQKLADGEAFSGRRKAEDDFDDYKDEADDASNYGDDDLGLD